MWRRIGSRLGYTSVTATLALFIALGGSASAIALITGAEVKDESLTGADVKNDSLTGDDLQESSLDEPQAPPPGPQVDPDSVVAQERTVTFRVTGALAPASVRTPAFSVTTWRPSSGWDSRAVQSVSCGAACGAVRITLADTLGSGELLRLIAKGSGPSPILGANNAPLAGATGSTGATAHDGQDFVRMLTVP